MTQRFGWVEQVPQENGACFGSGNQRAGVGKGQPGDGAGIIYRPLADDRPRGHTPDNNLALHVPGDNHLPIGTESHAGQTFRRLGGEKGFALGRALPGHQFPDHQRPIVSHRGQEQAIRAEGQVAHGGGMAV